MKSVKLKILLPMAIIGVLFVGLMANQYISMEETQEVIGMMTEKHYATVQLADELKLSVVQVQQWLTDISATRGAGGYDDGFDEAEAHAQRVEELLAELKRINPEYEKELQEIEDDFAPYYETGKKMAQAYIIGGPEMGNQTMEEFDGVATAINTSVDAFKQLSLENVDKAIAELDGDIQAVEITNFFAIVAMAVIIVLASIYMSRSIVQPIRLILGKLREMANNSGDLTQTIDYKGQDEIGQLAENFNKMQDSFRGLIRQVIEISEATSAGMDKTIEHIQTTADLMHKMNSKAESISAGMQENAASIEEITAAAEQVNGDIREIAQDAEKENGDSRKIRERAEKLRETAVASQKKAERVHEETRKKMELALENAKEVEKINALTDAIMAIANKTNLLALNASIEAARAGEAGKGFAVVAGEINQLASSSAESVEKIRIVNETIMSAVNDMVDTLKEVYAFIGEEVMKDYEETVSTGEHYQEDAELIYRMSTELTNLSDKISDSVGAIVGNMATVAQGSEMAAGDTMDISSNIAAANKDVDEITQLSGELYEKTMGLQRLVEKYTV